MVSDNTSTELGLSGRRILVVGAAQGIGKTTALRLSEMGARLVVADLQDCSDVAEECVGEATAVKLDMTEPASLAGVIEAIAAERGPIYGFVNCAGLLIRSPTDVATPEEVDIQTAVNQTGVFFLARAVMAHMREQGEGRMVFYTSQGAFTGGFHGSIPYAMNKAAVTALVKSMARVGAPQGITVNALAPGAVDTAMLRGGMSEEELEHFKTRIPMGRFADTNDVALPTAFLLSDWANYITGTTLHVNGGQVMV